MSRNTLRILAGTLILALLAACSQGPSEPHQYRATGTVYGHEGAVNQPLAAGSLLVDPEEAFGPSPVSLTEIVDGAYVGELASIDADGQLTLVFPSADDIPATLLRPAESLVYSDSFGLACNLEASDPSARVTAVGAEGLIFYTGVFFFTVDGAVPGMALAEPVPFPPASEEEAAEMRFQTWAYANKPVSIVSDPEICGDTASPPVIKVDVDLAEGWNHLEWGYIQDGSDLVGLELRNSTATDLYFYFDGPSGSEEEL